ncbi:MAG TPA: 3'-5' exonuclease [Burkholderiales bacterium]|jgi:ribonuclease D|nr:3'-5' exonuclease [Burkholderiales bacterium]HEX2650293.1 3'-5' exonuclease [Burkholderiales bacterium]
MALPAQYLRYISREEVNALPPGRYEGPVTVVDTPAALERAAADLRGEPAVGWDTETRPSFRKGESHPTALLQAAGSRAVHIFRLQQLDCSPALRELFGMPGTVKAGISVADDLKQLEGTVPGLQARSVVDLGTAARRAGLEQTGLRNLAAIFLGFRLPKGTKTTNWAASRLSAQQISYAATDAWACRELHLRFIELGLL